MSKNLGWRGAIVGILIVLAILYLTPSLSEEPPIWWSSFLPQEKIKLGLDLQGGMHMILEVEVEKAVESDLERCVEDIKEDLREKKIRYMELKSDGAEGIDLTIMRELDEITFMDMFEVNYSEDFEVTRGAEQEDGIPFKLTLKTDAKNQIMQMATDQAVETIRNRIDEFGVNETDIRPQEGNRILIQLPGIKDPERAIKLIGKTAQLEFKLVDEENSVEEALKGNMPAGREILYDASGDPLLLNKRASLTGTYLKDARVSLDEYNSPYILLSFDNKGARIFERVTGDNVGKRMAIVLDDNVFLYPSILEKIPGGVSEITGRFTMDEASDYAIMLRAGALPAPVKTIEKRTVGPSLGKDSIEKGFKSMIIGGIIVVLFMVIYYGFSGIIADLALVLNILFIMAGLAFFGATLTLPGIAGMILTIGMAVDANVLVFERIREELRLGKTPRTAIESGYRKALVTILDANVTTFIAALVLFQFGTGAIKGFAVTLSIGIVASFMTAVFVTRIVFDFLYIYRGWKKISI